MQRREFIQCLAALSLAQPFEESFAATTTVLVRQDIRTFSQDSHRVSQLRNAVYRLAGRGYTDPISWFNYAGIHEIASTDPNISKVPKSIQDLWHQCHKRESLFFLWHRAYVWALERLMQASVGDSTFRLPYWDWYTDPALPEIFRPKYVVVNGVRKTNPLYVANRNSGVNAGYDIWNPKVTTNFNETSFTTFQQRINSAEHGTIHLAVGTSTNMGNKATAARDPIFFLHHAQMDRLLMAWLGVNRSTHKAPTSYTGWDPTVYRFPVYSGGVVTPTTQELALGSMQAMGYSYENTKAPNVTAVVPASPGTVSGLSTMNSARILTDQATALSSSTQLSISSDATIELPISNAGGEKLRSFGMTDETSAPQSSRQLDLVLENVRLLSFPEGLLSYEVFLDLPPSPTRNADFEDFYVGSINLFELGHMGADHPGMRHTATLRFDITKKAMRVLRRSRTLRVSFVSVLSPGASSSATPVLEIGEARIEAATKRNE